MHGFFGGNKIKTASTTSWKNSVPDWRNLGVLLRTILVVNGLAVVTAAVPAQTLEELWLGIEAMAVGVEFPLMFSLLALYAINPWLRRLPQPSGWLLAVAIAWAVTSVWRWSLEGVFGGSLLRWLAWATAAGALVIVYFSYRSGLYSPAVSEARLLALTARIRPHFFFNSLNGVLGIIRSDPRRAEVALEELADLFRVLMRDNRELVTLQEEIELCHRYLGLEHLRLGERLQVEWQDVGCPRGALVPPLILQPLVENAVYHGIEPARDTGRIDVLLQRVGSELIIEVLNDLPAGRKSGDPPTHGNRIALENLRERLMLFFDLEASLSISECAGRFGVRIRLPCRTVQR